MFNWLQHLFTAHALQRENAELIAKNADLVKQVSLLQAKVDEQAEVIAVKDKEIGSLKNEPTESQQPLDKTREIILTILGKKGASTVKQFSEAINISTELANFHLIELLEKDFVNRPAPYASSETWSIAQDGRAYLVSHGLL